MTRLLGEPAPEFSLKDQHGVTHTLDRYRGRKNVIVMFFPQAFSGVCTGELAAVRESLEDFANDDVQLIGVSCDPMYALRALADRDALTFPLLSDFWPHGVMARAYGVFEPQLGCPARASFIIDKQGIVRWRLRNQGPQARDVEDYRMALKEISTEDGETSPERPLDVEDVAAVKLGETDGPDAAVILDVEGEPRDESTPAAEAFVGAAAVADATSVADVAGMAGGVDESPDRSDPASLPGVADDSRTGSSREIGPKAGQPDG